MAKKFAAAALARLATNHQPNAAEIAKVGAIEPLVRLCEGEFGDAAQEEAAGALFALADDDGNRVSITASNGIGPLVSLLGSSNFRARKHAEVSRRLSIESENGTIIIKKLVGMLVIKARSSGTSRSSMPILPLTLQRPQLHRRCREIAPLLTLLEHVQRQRASRFAISKLATNQLRSICHFSSWRDSAPRKRPHLVFDNVKEMMQSASYVR